MISSGFAASEGRSDATAHADAAVSADAAAIEQTAATIDLTSDAGASLVQGAWRYSDARIVDTTFRAPDVAGQPTGAPVSTYDIAPQAGVVGFDDSQLCLTAEPRLSSVRQPIEEMGREMARLLMQEIRLPDRAPRRVILDTQLVVRGSSSRSDQGKSNG